EGLQASASLAALAGSLTAIGLVLGWQLKHRIEGLANGNEAVCILDGLPSEHVSKGRELAEALLLVAHMNASRGDYEAAVAPSRRGARGASGPRKGLSGGGVARFRGSSDRSLRPCG